MITINNNYEIVKDEKGGYEEEAVKEKLTDYFDEFDYVVGDWAYGKLRLKGFNEKGNKNFKKINDSAGIDEYIEKYCAYGCRYFVLKKIKGW